MKKLLIIFLFGCLSSSIHAQQASHRPTTSPRLTAQSKPKVPLKEQVRLLEERLEKAKQDPTVPESAITKVTQQLERKRMQYQQEEALKAAHKPK
jgi:hypothetical protein